MRHAAKKYAVLCTLFLTAAQRSASSVEPPILDPRILSRHTRTLASDAFEGRAPGTPGEAKTVAYIVDTLRAAGIAPGGENGGYTQAVQMNRHTLERLELTARGARVDCQFPLGSDDAVLFTKRAAPRIEISSAPLVFVGYGIDAPELSWNDYAGIDVRGKIVVTLANDPDHESKSGPFEGPSMTYYGRLGYKAEEASRKGALAVLTINHPRASGYEWALARSLYTPPSLDIARDGNEKRVAFEGWLKVEAAERLFACAGQELEPLRKAAARKGFAARALDGITLSARADVKVEPSRTQNVIGVLRGSERPQETFIYTAHWDHMGRGKPDPTGDDIYNGAMDNAAGVAGLLELARAFATGPRPRRSVVFIATTLEESGLLGAEYYAAHPLFPLPQTAGGINMDAVNIFGATRTMEVTGMGKTTLEDLLEEELRKSGRTMQQDPNSVVGFYFRSDHFPFVKRGVPFLFTGSGWKLAEKKFPNLREPKIGTRFHQPCDEWSEALDFHAAARDLRIYYAVGRRIADSTTWPDWKPGVPWKSLRDRSAAQRLHQR